MFNEDSCRSIGQLALRCMQRLRLHFPAFFFQRASRRVQLRRVPWSLLTELLLLLLLLLPASLGEFRALPRRI
jgi:hypothetical protein